MTKETLLEEVKKGRAQRLRALLIKESYQIIRDPSSILISFLLPILLLFLYGTGVSLDLDHLKLGLALEDTSPTARSFAQSLTDSRYFDVKIAYDHRQLTDDLMKGNIRGIVVIPSYFSQFMNIQSRPAPIQVIADGSETNTANFVLNYVQGAFQNWLSQETFYGNLKNYPSISATARVWYNENLESRNFLLSGSLSIIMTLIGALLPALVVAREWERGTMEALISTPVQNIELILGKILPYFFLGMISMAMCAFVSVFIYNLPLRGSLIVLALVSAVYLFTSLGLGLMISTLTKNQIVAYQLTLVVSFLPAYILSGFLFEIHSMPKWIQWISNVMPATYFVQSLQTIFLVGNVWRLCILDMIAMLIVGVIFYVIIAKKTVKRLD